MLVSLVDSLLIVLAVVVRLGVLRTSCMKVDLMTMLLVHWVTRVVRLFAEILRLIVIGSEAVGCM